MEDLSRVRPSSKEGGHNPSNVSKKTTWKQAGWSLAWPILLLLALRWGFFEPYVIPSGSMLPTLQIHDHVLVNKWSFGLRWPWTDHWIIKWQTPRRGQILVFRSPEEDSVYFVKRLVGLPGEKIRWQGDRVWVDNQEIDFSKWIPNPESSASEDIQGEVILGPDQLFFLGDNRGASLDSRYFGAVTSKSVMGPVRFIWLACHQTLTEASRICDPAAINWGRMGRVPP